MTNKLVDGKYVYDNSKNRPEMVDYIDEVLQTIKLNLTVRRGSFYPNKNYGSLISMAELKKPENEYALAYARQALDSLDGVFVKSASLNEGVLTFDILINETERQVSLELNENL